MPALPHATDEQAARAIAHVSCVLLAAKNGNQHNENMIVLMDQATAMFQLVGRLEDALVQAKRELWMTARQSWTLEDFKNWAVVQQIDAGLKDARAALAQAPQQHQPTTR